MSIENQIRQKLETAFTPTHLTIINDSHRHQGHAGDNGTGESHFTVEIKSATFKGKSRPECHRMIYTQLDELLKTSIHALSIKASAAE